MKIHVIIQTKLFTSNCERASFYFLWELVVHLKRGHLQQVLLFHILPRICIKTKNSENITEKTECAQRDSHTK